MNIIDNFISRYFREYDFYGEAARLVSEQLESQLQANGIRGIVTYRAKKPDRLKDKLVKRNKDRSIKYQKDDDIYEDMVVLAGVRIALYFPADRKRVKTIIRSKMDLTADVKRFEGSDRADNANKSALAMEYRK